MEKKKSKKYDPLTLEDEIKNYWNDENIPGKIKKTKKERKNYYIANSPENVMLDASPSTVYKILLGDVWEKYQLMDNYNVMIKYGSDIFNKKVEKEFFKEIDVKNLEEVKNKDDEKLLKNWEKISKSLKNDFDDHLTGIRTWDNHHEDYLVSELDFINSVWWTITELHNKDLFQKRDRDVWDCHECDENFSKYKITPTAYTDTEYLIKLPVKSGENRFIFLKTSNLLSLLAPLCIGVSRKGKYSVVRYEIDDKEEMGIIQKSNLEDIMNEAGIENYEEANVIPGNKLNDMNFENTLNKFLKHRKTIKEQMLNKILAFDESIIGEKTELVTPGITENINDFSEEIDIGLNYYLDGNEKLGKNIKYQGEKNILLNELEKRIEKDLKKSEFILNKHIEERKEITCPQCSNDLDSKTIEEWSLKTEDIKNKIQDFSTKIDWIPEWGSPFEDRESLDEIEGWKISNGEKIGIQIPIWACSCGSEKVISTMDELKMLSDDDLKMSIFPHWFDKLDVKCDDCGEMMSWVGKSIHHNFIKSISSWTQLGYPDKEKKYQSCWPGNISFEKFMDEEEVIFGNLAISKVLFNEPSIKKYITYGKTDFEKSTSDMIEKIGYDSLRLAYLENSAPWEDREINLNSISKPKNVIKVLWNINDFLNNVKNGLDKEITIEKESLEIRYENLKIEDKWLLSRLQHFIDISYMNFENFRFDEIVSLMKEFVLTDIAQYYIDLARERIKKGDNIEKLSVFLTLEEVLENITKILSPIIPHISEKIFMDLNPKSISVFESEKPEGIDRYRNEKIEEWKEISDEVINDIFKLKKEMELPLKWPFQELVIDVSNYERYDNFNGFCDILKNKAKVKNITIINPDDEWDDLVLNVEANRDAIGKTYRQWASRIALLLENRDAEEIKKKIEEGEYMIGIEGHQTEIQPEMVTFSKEIPEGYVEVEYDDFNLYVNYEMSEEIWNEQIAKEIMLRIKSMRSEFELLDGDEVEVFILPPKDFLDALESHKDDILKEVGGKDIHILNEEIEEADYVVEWEVNGESVEIGIIPLYKTNVLQIYQSIPGMSKELSIRLYEIGYTSLDKIKNATAKELSDIKGFKRSLARRIVQTMKQKGDKLKNGEIEEKQLKAGLTKEKNKFIKELQNISGIGESVAKRITSKGYHSFEDIVETNVEKLMDIPYMKTDTAERLIEYSKKKHAPEIQKEDLPTKRPEESLGRNEDVSKGKTENEEEIKEIPGKISKSSTYMIDDKNIGGGFELFRDIVDSGMDGICVTREYPNKIRKKYDLEDVSILWLSNVDKENAIRPKNLENMILHLNKFLEVGNAVVLLSGIEYLIINNDFKQVLHSLQTLKDQTAISESILLIQIDSKELDDYQLDLLKSEMDDILT